MKTKIDTRVLAHAIAEQLFTNGVQERAERLVLEGQDKRDLGGWCFRAVVDVIVEQLRPISESA